MAGDKAGAKGKAGDFLNKLRKGRDGKERRSPSQYAREVVAEVKKVTWPTKKELLSYTGAVLAFVVLTALVIGVFDIGLTRVFDFLISFKQIIGG